MPRFWGRGEDSKGMMCQRTKGKQCEFCLNYSSLGLDMRDQIRSCPFWPGWLPAGALSFFSGCGA